jgi:hypothetical protein
MPRQHGYPTPPPAPISPPEWVAALRKHEARFFGHGGAPATERDLVSMLGAWDEDHESRTQATWQGLDDVLREG